MLKIKIILTNMCIGLFFVVSCTAQTGAIPIKQVSFQVDDRTDYVNVMGDEMPQMPQFPTLSKKPGFVRGYVRDALNQPIGGAVIGLKTARMYDAYAIASGETDAKGYYEIKIPLGGAQFHYAGFTISYSKGRAALGLHPADGKLSASLAAATGEVENFVMQPYGIADPEGVSNNARYRGNNYGGTMLLRYFIAPPGQDLSDFPRMLAGGSEIEITLTPEGGLADGNNFVRAFQIRKKVEDSSIGEFYICNVPIGRYRMEVKGANGKSLRLKHKNPTDSVFGIQPTENLGSASLLFNPLSGEAKTAMASRSNWTDLEIILERQ